MYYEDIIQDHPSVPDITKELLEALERLYPDKLPEFHAATDPSRVAQHVAYLQGQQSIITRLRFEYDQYTGGT